jgi:hypothetical protein
MLKKLLLASALTLAFSTTAMADDAPAVGPAGCTSCALPTSNANAPVKLAQVQMQAQQAPGRQAVRGDGDQGPFRSCCDPNLNIIPWGTFPEEIDTVNPNFANRYGVHFLPTAGFHTAMDLTTDIVRAMLFSPPWAVIIMEGEIKTDGLAGDTPAYDGTTTKAMQAFHNIGAYSGHNHQRVNGFSWSQTWMAGWASPGAGQVPATGTAMQTFSLANANAWSAPGGPHMKADGTLYALKPTFWVYYPMALPGGGTRIVKRPLSCIGLNERYAAFQKAGTSGMKVSAGANGSLGAVSSAETASVNQRFSLGNAIPATKEEIERIEQVRQGR